MVTEVAENNMGDNQINWTLLVDGLEIFDNGYTTTIEKSKYEKRKHYKPKFTL